MKKIGVVVLLLICGGLLTYYEFNLINEQKISYVTKVVALRHDLPEGAEISDQDLQIVSIPNQIYNKNYFLDKNDVVGNTLAIELSESALVSRQTLLEKSYFIPTKGMAMTSIRLTPEEMLCWEVEIGERVSVLHVNQDGALKNLGEVTVKGIYDQNLDQKSTVPAFLLIEARLVIVESIVSSRGNGRLEIIKVTNE